MDFRLPVSSAIYLFFICLKTSQTQVVNVAVNQAATQHTTLVYPPAGDPGSFAWTAGKAVDNCTLRDAPNTQQCCSASQADPTVNQWDLTLTRRYALEMIRLYARTDQTTDNQLEGFELYLSEEVGGTEDVVTPTPAGDNAIYTFSFTPPRNVSVITIKRPATFIVICELQAFAVCDAGFYGPGCTMECGGCLDNAACDRTTGVCPGDCEPGYYSGMCTPCGNCLDGEACNSTTGICSNGCAAGYRGDLCVQACENGTYGVNCNETCGNCVDTCNNVNGTCPASGCQAGWQGDMCDQECDSNMYGSNCSMSCGNCVDGEQCHHINGSCLNGCDPGWQADMCVDTCTNNTYGSDCNSTCGNCVNGTQCNHVNGACVGGCEAGYTGNQCITECTGNTYGENCSQACVNCLDGEQCNNVNGTCETGCAAGWQGDMCNTVCANTSFGLNCNETCYCAANATCNHVNGTCPDGDCQPGYFTDSCSMTCQNNTYGPGCVYNCGSCANETACDTVDGVCADGCAPGWLLSNCSQACANGTFGTNCTEDCGNCLDEEFCNFETGTCPSGCAPGWTGEFCKDECENGTFGINCSTRCFCADQMPCNKTTGHCPAGCELGYMGDYCQYDTNRAKGKPAYQSSTLFSDGFSWNASLAVDGNHDQENPETSQTCSSTEIADSAPWWCVDMEALSVVDTILVYGQLGYDTPLKQLIKVESHGKLNYLQVDGQTAINVDTSLLTGFKLYLSNDTMDNFTGNTAVFTQTGDYDNGMFNITLSAALTRYICVTQPIPSATGGMSICELRVFGECQDGTFGVECQDVCHCANDVPCNKTTGECPDGDCQPGWEPTTCSQPCQDNTYGDQCNEACGHCMNNAACDAINGTCYSGCSPGWQTQLCNEACAAGTYGQDCSSTCGQCKTGSCDHEDGGCDSGCAAGYKGTTCHDECEAGKYGENCANDCGSCKTGDVCDGTSGACPDGCQDGYQEPLCVAAIKQEDDNGSDSTNVGAIIGGIAGGIGFLILVFIIYKLVQRNRKKSGADYFTTYQKDYGASSETKDADEHSYSFVNKSFSTKF